jgi:hypothetical protein
VPSQSAFLSSTGRDEATVDDGQSVRAFLVCCLFLNGLTLPSQFAKEAPAVMHAFLSHGDTCTNIETKAMQIANRGLDEYDDDGPTKEQAVADEDMNLEANMSAKFEKLMKTFEEIMQNIGGLCSSGSYASYLQLHNI